MPFSDQTLAPLINMGYGLAAKFLGLPYIHYRPKSAGAVLNNVNMLDTLYLAFDHDKNYGFTAPIGYKQNAYFALLDLTTVNVGDYLYDFGKDTFFVASIEPLKAAMLVLCNRTITVQHPATNNGYGGGTADANVLTNWPCSIIDSGIGGTEPGDTPAKVADPGAMIYLPYYTPIVTYDLIIDDLGRRYEVGQNEQTSLGYRLDCRYTGA